MRETFSWNTFPFTLENKAHGNLSNFYYDAFRGVTGYTEKPQISEAKNIEQILSRGCDGISQHWNAKSLYSNKTFQSSIHLMSANTLYNCWNKGKCREVPVKFKPEINQLNFRGDLQKISWSPEKAAEVLEDWLRELIKNIESEKNSYFFSPNFVDLPNKGLKDLFLSNLGAAGINCLITLVTLMALKFKNVLVALWFFIIANFLAFVSFTVSWAAIIFHQESMLNQVFQVSYFN
jgi:hypothetical protein